MYQAIRSELYSMYIFFFLQYRAGSPLFCYEFPISEANDPSKWKYGLVAIEFTQAEIDFKLLKKVAKTFLKWTLKLATVGAVNLELENTKMPLFLNILDQKPWIDSVLNGACDSVWPEEMDTGRTSNCSRINLSILIRVLIGLKSLGIFLGS